MDDPEVVLAEHEGHHRTSTDRCCTCTGKYHALVEPIAPGTRCLAWRLARELLDMTLVAEKAVKLVERQASPKPTPRSSLQGLTINGSIFGTSKIVWDDLFIAPTRSAAGAIKVYPITTEK